MKLETSVSLRRSVPDISTDAEPTLFRLPLSSDTLNFVPSLSSLPVEELAQVPEDDIAESPGNGDWNMLVLRFLFQTRKLGIL